MGIEIAVDETILMTEVQSPPTLKKQKFESKMIPAAVFPHIIHFMQ